MKFTQQGKEIDKQIKNYLDTVVKIILKEFPGVRSILLGGGSGRGEGSVCLDEKGKAIPQNDFEFFLITSKPIKEELINKVANKAIREIDIGPSGADFYNFKREIFANTFYIDMKVIPISKLPFLLPMFRYYELKHASHLLWGRDYRYLIPDYQIKDFPTTEGLRLLLNRMALLCLYFSFDFLDKMSFAEKHGLMYLGSKAFTDLAGALTQINGCYLPSYLGRLEILKKTYQKDFPELAKKCPEIPEIVKEGTMFKLYPNFDFKIRPYQLWSKQKKYIKEVLIYFCNHYFKKSFKNVFQVADFLYQEGYKHYHHPYLDFIIKNKMGLKIGGIWTGILLIPTLNILYFLRVLKYKKKFCPRILFNKRTPDLTMFAAMIYILYGTKGKNKISRKKLGKAKYYLEKTYPLVNFREGESILESWETLKDDFSGAFLLFSLLKIA